MKKISLNGIWSLKGKKQTENTDEFITLPAEVPGCVQLDLSKNGHLPENLYMGMNILENEKYEDYEWWYETTFTAPDEKENVYLVFEGVDCLAEYFLNGKKIGESDNMFITHEFKIDEFLVAGENTLTVHLSSVTVAAEDKDYTLKVLNNPQNLESRHIRKTPHCYGWDIMPRAVTAGLWREVRLEVRDEIYFTQTFFKTVEFPFDFTQTAMKLTIAPKCKFFYTLDCKHDNLSDVEIELSASCGNDSGFSVKFPVKKKFGTYEFEVKNPKLWNPYGYGEPNVYDGTAKIIKNKKTIHEEKIYFGIRKVEFDRRDPLGEDIGQFRILVNDNEIMVKGTNWVPMDAFHSNDAARYDKALELLKESGGNIVRCWGGNVYEDHKFFDFCDRNGIMVWQDFAMACASYPEDDEFKKQMEKEATAVIRKLRNHPSLVVWAGDNEVDASTYEYNPENNPITREILPKCVELNDIGRPYIPSSPYITGEMQQRGVMTQIRNTPLVEDHLWGPRDYFKSDFYRVSRSHFVSEIGYHGCPDLESIKKFITPDKVWPYHNNAEWILHSSDQKGDDSRMMLLEKQVRQLFGIVPENPEDFILASQISQAEANKYFLERARTSRPEKTGIIWWNLIDGWPQFSDAVVDYYYNKKLSFYYNKRSQAPFIICGSDVYDWHVTLFASNDTPTEKSGKFKVTDTSTGEVIYTGEFEACANTCTKIARIPVYHSEQKILYFEWEVDGERGFNHYLCGYPPISFEMYKEVMEKYNLRG